MCAFHKTITWCRGRREKSIISLRCEQCSLLVDKISTGGGNEVYKLKNMPRLTRDEGLRAQGMLEAGMLQAEVARRLNCNRSTISRLCQRIRLTGQTHGNPRSGRPRISSLRTDRHLHLRHLRDRFLTATQTAREFGISRQTVSRRLRERGLRCRRPYRGPILTAYHRRERLRWARQHYRWRLLDWRRVIFSDESRFRVSRADGRVRLYRRLGERYNANCVFEHDRFGGGSVMVWGAINEDFRSNLIIVDEVLNGERYVNNVLTPGLLPLLQNHGPGMIFQQDNARPHTARITRQYLQGMEISVLPWPAMSPDLSPIEHVWDAIDRRVRNRPIPLNNVAELRNALLEEWDNIPQELIRRCTLSMRRRCGACIAAYGGHTRY